MRWVLDTNVVASALLWGGMPRQLLEAGQEKRVDLFTSLPLLAELTDVLGRRRFERKIAASQFSVDELVDRYAALAALVRPLPIPRVVSDPDDDVVIGTALAARAELIVTGDRRVLAVGAYRNVRIVTVGEAVQAELGRAGLR